MTRDSAITESDLHAYADGLLGTQECARVEQWLELNPQAREKVQDWQAHAKALRQAFAPYHTAKYDDQTLLNTLQNSKRRTVPILMRTAAACLMFVAGAVAGQFIPLFSKQSDIATGLQLSSDISTQAGSAYLIYASEVRHPVEVGADQQAHLATWLGKRLGYPFAIPDLTSIGYELVGGRLLPVSGKPGAMLMYQSGSGERVTVLVGRNPQNRTTSFRLADANGVATFYWIDNDIGYAVSGEISHVALRRIAEECYRQFPT
ncbi:anti-sigma factor [Agrobacterium sp.]|jgi:anti-sigma factor RsiW|uniref:anti-sigma factor family protein n=1 Tax=Agrobacterium sp. TaxID=361 RepID=UPI0028A90471|nr:anti-sigma factor [Agrobacterium sp.]